MSDSTREKTPPQKSDDAGATPEPAHPDLGGTGGWWVVSAVIHGMVLLALLWFTPLRTIILQPGETVPLETTANADRIEEVVAEIRDHQAEEIAFEVEELLDITDTLEDLREGKLEDFDQFAESLAKEAPNETLAAQDEALKAQQEALAKLAEAQQAADEATRTQADAEKAQPAAATAALDKAKKAQQMAQSAHKKARDAQSRADEAQTKAAQMLAMLDETMKDALDVQKQAIAAQSTATAAETGAEDLQLNAGYRHDQVVARQKNVAQQTRRVAERAAPIKPLEPEVKKLTDQAAQAKKLADEAQKTYRDVREQASQADRAVSRAKEPEARKQARSQAEAAKKRSDAARKAADAAKAELRRREQKARETRERLARARRDLADATKRRDQVVQEAKKTQDAARDDQTKAAKATREAHDAQQRAIDAQKKARDALGKALKNATPVAAARPKDADKPDAKRPELFDRNVADLYRLAVTTEEKSTEAYKDVRAADLAILRKIPLAEARGQTEVAKPLRPELDEKLLTGAIRDMATADRHKKEVETAIREIRSMVTLGRRMLAMAQGTETDGGSAVSLDWYRAKTVQAEEMTRAAKEDSGAVAKDLSGLMKAAAADSGAEGAGHSGSEGSAGSAAAAAAAASAAQGKKAQGHWGRLIEPPVVRRDLKAIPGRKVLAAGIPAKWMYVDSWYVIGPFPNPRRINRDKKFPPESVVDLDARYIGKDGKIVRWEFMKTAEPEVLPPKPEEYAIYYAYTELWFEKAMDLWIAVGSDDKSSLWIEDQPVWVSADHLKSWQIAEGMRRVHFKKGINRVLYRIENGWRHVGWSLVIHTNSPGAAR